MLRGTGVHAPNNATLSLPCKKRQDTAASQGQPWYPLTSALILSFGVGLKGVEPLLRYPRLSCSSAPDTHVYQQHSQEMQKETFFLTNLNIISKKVSLETKWSFTYFQFLPIFKWAKKKRFWCDRSKGELLTLFEKQSKFLIFLPLETDTFHTDLHGNYTRLFKLHGLKWPCRSFYFSSFFTLRADCKIGY